MGLKSKGSDGETPEILVRHLGIGPEITKYLKRVRKQSKCSFRYLLVMEAHKSGLPHYHMFLHETPSGGEVPKRILKYQWHLGFTDFKLVDDAHRRADYICKYLAKSNLARVRASKGYGSNANYFASNDPDVSLRV